VRRLRETVKELFTSWSDHNASTQAAALAFYTLFSLAPVLVVVVAVAGAIFGADAVRGQIYYEFRQVVGEQTAGFVQQLLQSAAQPKAGTVAAILGTATLVFGASGVFVQLQDALNTIWGVCPKPGAVFTTLLRKRLLSFATILGIGFLLMVSLVLSAGLTAFGNFLEAHLKTPLWLLDTGNFFLSFLLITLLFALIYKLLPDVRLTLRDVGSGAVVTSLLFTVGKAGIGFYIGHTSTASAYGAAGSAVILLLWVYYSTLIFLVGAEFTRIYSRRHREIEGKSQARPEEGAVRVENAAQPAPGPARTAAR